MKTPISRLVLVALLVNGPTSLVFAQNANPIPEVHIVWMGGNDCPPCVAWRQNELPKLRKSPEFQRVKFSYVQKSITSAVPPKFFLPTEAQPYKDKLDRASAGRSGSPQAAILVNGEVFDYFHGTRTAAEFEQVLLSIRTGTAYPFQRCVRVSKEWRKCEQAG